MLDWSEVLWKIVLPLAIILALGGGIVRRRSGKNKFLHEFKKIKMAFEGSLDAGRRELLAAMKDGRDPVQATIARGMESILIGLTENVVVKKLELKQFDSGDVFIAVTITYGMDGVRLDRIDLPDVELPQ